MPLPRFHIQGHVYYVTTNVYRRLRLFTRPSLVLPLLDSLNFYRHKYTFKLLGYVIMPDHLHLLVWPQDPEQMGAFMRDFKKFTAVRLIRQVEVERDHKLLAAFEAAGSETGRSDRKVWQDSYWDLNIYTERFLRQKLNYMHRNPVRSRIVEHPEAYPYSSYRNYVLGDEALIEIDRGWL